MMLSLSRVGWLMTTLNDGTTYCDKCGVDLTPANIVNSVITNAMIDAGESVQIHHCFKCSAQTVTSRANLRSWQERNPDKVFRLFNQERDESAP